MKKLYSFITVFIISTTCYYSHAQNASYCDAYFVNGCSDYLFISSVATSGGITNLNNLSNGCSNDNSLTGYGNYTAQSVSAPLGGTVDFTLQFTTTQLGTAYLSFWIDWNQDNVFSDNEQLYESDNQEPASLTFSVAVPATAALGSTRIRIKAVNGWVGGGSCGFNSFGEVEDYTFTVTEELAAPTALTITTQGNVPAAITTNDGTLQLIANVTPVGTSPAVVWSITSGAEFATINVNGLLNASSNGTVVVTAASAQNAAISNTITVIISGQALPPVIVPVTVTSGFTHDIIANGVGNASATSTVGFDEANSRALVSLDFQATDSSNLPTYGLPANGTIESAVTPGVTFQLANYTGPNALFLTPSYVNNNASNSGTLNFGDINATNLYILAGAAGGGLQTLPFTTTIHFTDNTTQDNILNVNDWYNGNGAAIVGIGRVNRANNNLEGDSSNPRLYEIALPISLINQGKSISSISFSFEGNQSAEYGSQIRMSILALTRVSEAEVPGNQITITTANNVPSVINVNNGNLQLVATVTPVTEPVTWAITSGGGSATIDANGLLSAIADGTVTVTATTSNGTLSDSIDISITNQIVIATAIEVATLNNVEPVIIINAGTLQLVANILPANSTDATVVWNITSGSEFANIDAQGLVTAISNGTVTVTATTVNGILSDTIEIVISNQIIEVTAITISTLNNTPATITTAGGTLTLVATIIPADATDTTVTWSITSGSEFATIDQNGVVAAIGNGTVTVAATSASGATAAFDVIVDIPTAGVDNLITANFNVYPNPCTGLANISADKKVKSFEVYNNVGQKVVYGKGNLIDLQQAQQGVYFVKISFEGGAINHTKIIKN